VRIHYIVGNHDWFYHLGGPAYDEIRQDIIKAIGLANPAGQPFPHDPSESAALEALYQAHQVFARHGDIYDPANFEDDRNSSSLGDAVVVELLNRFPSTVAQMMGPDLPPATRDGLKEVDNVRPVLAVPIWVNGLLRRTVRDQGRADRIKEIWDDLADEFLNLPFVRARDKALDFFDNVDKLEWALKFSKGVSLQFISQVVTWLNEKLTGGEVTYHRHAFEELAFRRKLARYIVHGHTHHRELVPLDFTLVNGKPFEQIYFNSGTWRRVHGMARFNPQQQEFLSYYEMTYFAFYKEDERKGRPFEMWGGALGG
jgi:UDP-2,3-diacylglucosamine pyrophosphatase LpxH